MLKITNVDDINTNNDDIIIMLIFMMRMILKIMIIIIVMIGNHTNHDCNYGNHNDDKLRMLKQCKGLYY